MGMHATTFRGKHLIRRDRDRADLLLGAAVLADFALRERRPLEKLAAPLPSGNRVRHEHEARALECRHRARPHGRLARPAREHDHAAAALREVRNRLALIRAKLPCAWGIRERNRMAFAVHETREILDGPPQFEELLLEGAALARVYERGGLIDARTHERRDAL